MMMMMIPFLLLLLSDGTEVMAKLGTDENPKKNKIWLVLLLSDGTEVVAKLATDENPKRKKRFDWSCCCRMGLK
jgi:hypothetical protein